MGRRTGTSILKLSASVIDTSSITDPSSISTIEESYPSMGQDLELGITKDPNKPAPEVLRSFPQSNAHVESQRIHTDPSLYTRDDRPLKFDYIRILTVRQGAIGDTLECTLTSRPLWNKTSQFNEAQPYEVLSYDWDPGNPSFTIEIYNPEGFTADFKIRPNLFQALQHLRLPDRPRRLWVDAIRINQDNVEEKNAQALLMAEMFSGATHLCVWLGEQSADSKLALNFISRMVNLHDIVADRRTLPECVALSSLMRRSWFSRRWVVQEIALADRATSYCGDA